MTAAICSTAVSKASSLRFDGLLEPLRALSVKYEPFDDLYWLTQLGAERSAMIIHRETLMLYPNDRLIGSALSGLLSTTHCIPNESELLPLFGSISPGH